MISHVKKLSISGLLPYRSTEMKFLKKFFSWKQIRIMKTFHRHTSYLYDKSSLVNKISFQEKVGIIRERFASWSEVPFMKKVSFTKKVPIMKKTHRQIKSPTLNSFHRKKIQSSKSFLYENVSIANKDPVVKSCLCEEYLYRQKS